MGNSWICLFYSLLPLYNEVSNKLSYAPMVMFYIIIDKESVESRTEPSVIVIHHKSFLPLNYHLVIYLITVKKKVQKNGFL